MKWDANAKLFIGRATHPLPHKLGMKEVKSKLEAMGFVFTGSNPCLFSLPEQGLLQTFHVDDLAGWAVGPA